jgi:acyl-CoA dehydrogenase
VLWEKTDEIWIEGETMYSFEPTDEQRMLIDAVSRYASSDLRKAAHDAEESKELPARLVSKGWELGVLQASIPEAYGGFGERSALTGVLVFEEMAYGDLAGALAVGVPALFALPLLLAGFEEQKKEHIPAVIEADWKPFTAAMVELRGCRWRRFLAQWHKDNGAIRKPGRNHDCLRQPG